MNAQGLIPLSRPISSDFQFSTNKFAKTELADSESFEMDQESMILDMLRQSSEHIVPDLPVVMDAARPTSKPVLKASSGWRVVRMRVTGYCACSKCCGTNDGITANNHRIRSGDVFVAADKKFRFGTEMKIPGYNMGKPVKVYDRGRLIKGNCVDVFFHSHSQAKKWGVRYLDVLVKTER